MGVDEDLRKFIMANLAELSECTDIGVELVLRMYEKKLIGDDERYLLVKNASKPIQNASMLYTRTVKKWSNSQFEEFKTMLRDTGNSKALEIFTNKGGDVFLTNDEVQLLKEQRFKSESGCYEGLFYEDELVAKQAIQLARGDNKGMFGEDGRFTLSDELNRKEIIPIVKLFLEILKNEVIWWNPRKPPLPQNYVERRVATSTGFQSDERTPNNDDDTTLIQLVLRDDKKCVTVLVDPPGMGKSSEVSHLEQKLRMKVIRHRIIVRINLNEVQSALATLSPSESVLSVLLKLAPFLPAKSLQISHVSLFLLIDGLDEVRPSHQNAMIHLLRIFTSAEEQTESRNIRVLLTTRPHLRAAVESAFNLKSVSILPLTEEEQEIYMGAVLKVTSEQLRVIRRNLPPSVTDLLSNPLMLSMFVEVLKSDGGSFSGDVNIFELYTKFLYSKNKLLLVEKGGTGAEAYFTEMVTELIMRNHLPFYYQVSYNELVPDDATLPPSFTEYIQRLATTLRPAFSRAELLSVGLLIEGSDNQLVFKHRSFGEFFYAMLLTQEDSVPQVVRDTLFNQIYVRRSVLENVETFVAEAAASSLHTTSLLLLHLSPKWLLNHKDFQGRCELVNNIVGRGKLFPLLAKELLASFVDGEPGDLWEVHRVLLHKETRASLLKLLAWMRENIEWTRKELLHSHVGTSTTPTVAVARLIVAIGVKDEDHFVLSQEEVRLAINSVDRLIYVLASVQSEGRSVSKWEWAEDLLLGGRSQLKNLFMQSDDKDISAIIEDVETTWKMRSLLAQAEIHSLISDEETRVSDILGERPREVILAFGNMFVLRGRKLTEFRGKLGKNKGKTILQMRAFVEDKSIHYIQ